MIGLSGIEYKILRLASADYFHEYWPAMHGPWYLKVFYDLGLLQKYIDRLVAHDFLRDMENGGYGYELTDDGLFILLDYWQMSFG